LGLVLQLWRAHGAENGQRPQIETRALNQAVKRNLDRFPDEFAFPLTRDEILRISQL